MRSSLRLGYGAVGVVFATWAILAACTDFSDTPDTGDGAAVLDAGSLLGDASPSTSDASPTTGDAGPLGDATAPHFCNTVDASRLVFCSDFDDGEAVDSGTKWPFVYELNGVVVRSTTASSPPYAASATVVSGLSDGAYAVLGLGIVTAGTAGFHVEADVQIVSSPPDTFMSILRVTNSFEVGVAAARGPAADLLMVGDGGADPIFNLATAPFPAGWFKLGLDVNVAANTARLYVQGQAVTQPVPIVPFDSTSVTVTLGISTTPQNGSTVLFDNVVVTRL